MKLSAATIALLAVVMVQCARATTYQVGAERAMKSLKAIAAQLKPGDVVEIDPGVYREVLKLQANGTKEAPITIRGVGAQRPVFDADGLDTSGRGPIPRGIFQIEGAYYVIEHLEFKNARNHENSAGVRLLASTNAVIRDCKVSYCDMGIFGDDRETVTIESCDIGFNSTKDRIGYAHNFYMHGNRVLVRACHIHDCPYGQNFKSRAHYNELWYNWIADSGEGEVGPVDARDTASPNSNTLLVGNVVVSAPERQGNNAKFVLFGSELGGSHDGTLYLYHNTFVAGNPRIQFVNLADAKARAVIRNNIFIGSRNLLVESRPAVSVVADHNFLPANAVVPPGWMDNITGTDPGFVDAAARDFHLKPDALPKDKGGSPLQYVDGDGVTHTLAVDQSYVPDLKLAPRQDAGAPDIGAYAAP